MPDPIHFHCPDITKSAGRLGDTWKLFRKGFGRTWNRQGAQHAETVAKRFTNYGDKLDEAGKVLPAQGLDEIRNSPKFLDRQRIKFSDKATRLNNQADLYDSQIAAMAPGILGNTAARAGGFAANVPRFALAHPASFGLGTMAAGAVFPKIWDYTLPNMAGSTAYHLSGRSKKDAIMAGQAGATQAGLDFYDQFRSMPFTDRMGYAWSPPSPASLGLASGVNANRSAPSTASMFKNFVFNGGKMSPEDLMALASSTVNNTADTKFNQYFNKSGSVAKGIKNLWGVAPKVTNLWRKTPRAARAGLGASSGAAFPVLMGMEGYSGERENVLGNVYNQAYSSGQYQVADKFAQLPWWMRMGAGISPEMAAQFAMQRASGSQSPVGGMTGPPQHMYRGWNGRDFYPS